MRTRQIITVLVLVLTLGLHWAALQSVAWVSMIIRYSQHATLPKALAQTFDGQHPCALCRFVADGKKAEHQEHQPPLTLLKFDFLCEAPDAFVFAEIPPNQFELGDLKAVARFEPPPSPPPRFV
jgi:hypothetical protein